MKMVGRNRRKPRQQGRARRKDIIGILLILLSVVAALCVLFAYLTIKRASYDPVTLCPLQGPDSLTVVLVDHSDGFNERQQTFIRERLRELRDEIRRNGRIEIYAFGPEAGAMLRPKVSLCNPGRGSEVNQVIESPRRAEKRWQAVFDEPLREVFTTITAPGSSQSSPIFEAIQSVAITSLQRREMRNIPKQLIVVSDLMQYVPAFNQYRGLTDFETLRSSPYYARVKTSLRDVDVVVFYVFRDTSRQVQGIAHTEFWSRYFLDQGASNVRIRRVEG